VHTRQKHKLTSLSSSLSKVLIGLKLLAGMIGRKKDCVMDSDEDFLNNNFLDDCEGLLVAIGWG